MNPLMIPPIIVLWTPLIKKPQRHIYKLMYKYFFAFCLFDLNIVCRQWYHGPWYLGLHPPAEDISISPASTSTHLVDVEA